MENSTPNRQFVFNSLLWKMLERVFSQGINLIVQIILARLLLPSDFGSLAIIVAITNYAALFVQSGLGTAIIQKKNLEQEDVSTLLTASLVLAFVLYLIIYLLAPWISDKYNMPDLLWPLRVLALILFLNGYYAIQSAVLTRKMDFKSIFFCSAFAVPIAGGVGIWMAYEGFGLWALVTHNLVNMLVLVIVMSIVAKQKIHIGFSWGHAKPLYSFSVNILLSQIVSGFSDTVRTMTIGKRYTPQSLAYYDKAYTYPNYVAQIVNASIGSVMLPTLSRSQDDLANLKRLSRRSISLTATVMIPVLIAVMVMAKPLVLLILTEKWAPCIPYLMLFCFFRIPGCIASVDKQVFFALGKSNISLFYELGLMIVGISTLAITVHMGLPAIAIGATCVEYLGTIVLFCIGSRLYHYTIFERIIDLRKPIFNSIVMGLAVYAVGLLKLGNFEMLLVQVPVAIVCYYLMSKLTKDENLGYIFHLLSDRFKTKQ